MPKNTIADYSATAASNTDIQGVDIDEGCAPSGINNAIRELMADLADVDAGTVALTSPNLTAFSIGGTAVTATAAQLNEAGSFANTFTLPTADGTSGQVLQTDGSGGLSFADGSGGITGPASATDWEIPRFNGTTGDVLEGSGAIINAQTGIVIVPEGAETGGGYSTLLGANNFDNSAAQSNAYIASVGHDIMMGYTTVGAYNGGGSFLGRDLCSWAQSTGSPTMTRFPAVNIGQANVYQSSVTTTGVSFDLRSSVIIGYDNITSSTQVPTTVSAQSTVLIGESNMSTQRTGNMTVDYSVGVGYGNYSPWLNSTGAYTTEYNYAIGSSNFNGYIASNYTYDASYNVAVGNNILSGINATSNGTATYNTGIGRSALSGNGGGTTSNNTAVGYNAGTSQSPSGNLIGSSNKICLGNNSITQAYVKVSWTVTSDERDKADKANFNLGLDQINQINPIAFKWDMRSDYFVVDENGNVTEKPTPDGTHKKEQQYLGFSAQELKTVFDAAGAPAKTIVDDSDAENLKLKESALLPVMVNAIKQLSAKCDSLQAQIDAMGA